MKYWTLFLLLVTCVAFGKAEKVDMKTIPPQTFLAIIREPLRDDAWGEFTGRVIYKGRAGKIEGILRVRVTFSPKGMSTQIVLNDQNVYALEQKHAPGKSVQCNLDKPRSEIPPGLFDFGIQPTDLTLAFLYWEFIEEIPNKEGKLGDCRVMKLKEPNSKRTVDVWFNLTYGFPEKVVWYEAGATEPCRQLEMKGAKRHANGLWFVREMKLSGSTWKSLVTFDHVELNEVKPQ